VFRGLLGFSAPDSPQERRWGIVRDAPALVMIADTEDRIRAFLPVLDEVMDGGLATLSTHGW
jgi:PII-like signaling protein